MAARAAYEANAAIGAPTAEALGRELTRALEDAHQATVSPRYPVNYAFSTCGTELCVHSVQGGFEAAPHEPKISDNNAAMYNSIDCTALFTALHERPEFQSYMSLYRVLYGRPAQGR
jgi:hypothetical protein